LNNISDIYVNINKDGKGTITFGVAKYKLWMNSYNLFPELGGSRNSPKFEMIDDAKSVYDQIKHLQRIE
jgi:hypothetical protein